ncbi:MAG: biotin/lipoyl-containing protein [Candidatus Thorarchaeota archaeon]
MWRQKRKPLELAFRINGDLQKVRVVSKQKRGGYVVEINEKRFEVDLSPFVELESFIVSVDRCPYEVLGSESLTPDSVTIDGEQYEISFGWEQIAPIISLPQGSIVEAPKPSTSVEIADQGRTIVSPMPGMVLQINVQVGQEVHKDEILLVYEAMKMENSVICPRDGVVKEIFVKIKDRINRGDPLFVVE